MTALPQWPLVLKVREDKLLAAIADKLDRSQRSAIRARCANIRDEFRGIFEGEIGATEKRNMLRKVEQTCLQAARAITAREVGDGTLQDADWLPQGEFTICGRQFVRHGGSTKLAEDLWVTSELAKQAARKLVLPKAHREHEKDVIAGYAYMLVADFPPRRSDLRIAPTASDTAWYKKKPRAKPQPEPGKDGRSHEQIIEELWPTLSPRYRAVHNRLRAVRKLPPIPAPESLYRPPRRGRSEFQEPSSSPSGPYLAIAPLLFEYCTGRKPEAGLEASCRLAHLGLKRARATIRR